ncbi:TetR family transcriptional regulator [Nitratireductor sp. CAU 1489]|uniref:TetR family transcriptional regulator n=1 Tax=Nitratireductor arenosus TaxID=2682096 RepID=A0A844QG35_9HYPH|nr:TetR/AcrR family transcriptional regulator [Nitratireductor arenosus]MVA98312.1 TetR family transcriptional regulator [Nitratireductor arenosus]
MTHDAPAPRKTPVQKRSRERFERMLGAATELIAEAGSDALKMSDVASRAGVSIGSLYQFFPDKSAILATLVERCNAQSRHCIEQGLAGIGKPAELGPAFAALFDIYYAMFLAEPALRDIWAGAQADKALSALQLEESRANAATLTEVLKRLFPHADREVLATRALLVMHLGEEAMRLAVSVPRVQGDRLVEAYKRMAARELLADPSPD